MLKSERRRFLFLTGPLSTDMSAEIACVNCASLPRAMCGVVGIFGHPEAANLAYLGLYALQHRGQESAGIVSTDGDALRAVREMGHVNDIFTATRLTDLPGFAAIGHVRYSTAGDSSKKNAQPIAVDYAGGSVAVGHNGNLVNAVELREQLEADGSIFQTTSDTEVIVHLIARSRERTLPERIADALRQVRGAYSLVFLSETMLIAVRDPMGFRPLVARQAKCKRRLGRRRPRPARSSCIEAEFVRDVEPGRDGRSSTSNGLRSRAPVRARRRRTAACSSGSTSRAPTRPSTAARSTARASGWGAGWPSSIPSPPTSSSRCPTPASPPPSATRARAASPTTRG